MIGISHDRAASGRWKAARYWGWKQFRTARLRLADAAQDRGEVAKDGDNLPRVSKQNSKPTAADIGLTRKQVR
jgi:hypothetical protein